jgi:RimJ/RimL family protein N-acetyltransferase
VTAEVALEVVDAEQGRGIGTVLLDAVTTVAAVHGIERVQAMVLQDNTPSRRLLQHLGIPLAWSGEALEGEGPLRLLTPPRLDRARVVALAARTRSGPDQASTTASASSHWEGEGSIDAGARAG